MGLFNRERLPADVSALVPKGERVMAWAVGAPMLDGQPTYVIATAAALYAPGFADRIPWEDVIRAAWEDPVLEVVSAAAGEEPARELPTFDELAEEDEAAQMTDSLLAGTDVITSSDASLVRITLDAAGSVPQVVRERVGATIVMQRHVKLREDNGFRLVARRLRNRDDIRWQVVFDPGINSADPRIRERADAELRAVRESVGI